MSHLVYPGGPLCQPNCPGEHSMYHDGYADGYDRADAEAVRAALTALRAELNRLPPAWYGAHHSAVHRKDVLAAIDARLSDAAGQPAT